MASLLATLRLLMLIITTTLFGGSARYFTTDVKDGMGPLTVTFSTQELYDAEVGLRKYVWNFGDGQTLISTTPKTIHTYKSPGTYKASLQYFVKKTNTLSVAMDGGSLNIQVFAKPNALPIAVLSCISNSPMTIDCKAVGSTDKDGSIISYKYEWGDGTSSVATNENVIHHTYQTAGIKNIKLILTDNSGGVGVNEQVYVLKTNTAPVANFVCNKLGVQKIHCESTSTDNEDILSNFKWILDDGATYSTSSFDHTFTRPQDVALTSHSVSLKVTDPLGLSSVNTKNILVDLEIIKFKPEGYFKAYIDGTSLNLHSFVEKTQFDIKRAYYTIQSFPDLRIIKTIEIPDFYADTLVRANLENYGKYKITMSVVDMRNQLYETTRIVPLAEDTMALPPALGIIPVQSAIRTVYLKLSQAFDYDESSYIEYFVINYGDGHEEENWSLVDYYPTHTYATAGKYDISITAYTDHGTQLTEIVSIDITDDNTVALQPSANFTYNIYDFAQHVSFYYQIAGSPNGQIISSVWDFGDGTTSTGEEVAHFYEPGTYIVTLTVTDIAGFRNSQSRKITVLAAGDNIVAHISWLGETFAERNLTLAVYALDKNDDISQVRISWGDGSPWQKVEDFYNGVSYQRKKYSSIGTYDVVLSVNTNRGESKTYSSQLVVREMPIYASLECSSMNLMVYCDALGSYYPSERLTYTFDYQDGFSETNETGISNHAYKVAGLHSVNLTITTPKGKIGKASAQVQTVISDNFLPFAVLFCVTDKPLTVTCSAIPSYDNDGTIVNAKFEYDDGHTETHDKEYFFDHRFQVAGTHFVKLTVTDNDGGQSSITQQFTIKENKAPILTDFNCYTPAPHSIDCYADAYDSDFDDRVINYKWEMDDSKDAVNQLIPSLINYRYDLAGTRNIKLTVTDQYGESTSLEKTYVLVVNQLPVALMNCYSEKFYTITCDSNSYDPEGRSFSEAWTLPDGNVLSGKKITYVSNSEDLQKIILKVTDEFGGTSEISKDIYPRVDKPTSFKIYATRLNNILPLKVHFKAENVNDPDGEIVSYLWDFGNGQTSTESDVVYTYIASGDYIVKLRLVDSLGGITEKTLKLDNNIEVMIPPSSVDPLISVNVSYDENSKLYTYNYKVQNKVNSSLDINNFMIQVNEEPSIVSSPTKWLGRFAKGVSTLSHINWRSFKNDVKVGQLMSEFVIKSINPPGVVRYYLSGKAKVPSVQETEDNDEPHPEVAGYFFGLNKIDRGVTGVVQGPVEDSVISTVAEVNYKGSSLPLITPADVGSIEVSVADSEKVDIEKINISSLTLGFGKGKPLTHSIVNKVVGDPTSVKKLVLTFNLSNIKVRCNIDYALYMEGQIEDKKFLGAIKIKPDPCKPEYLKFEQ